MANTVEEGNIDPITVVKMRALDEKIDQLELVSQLGIITPDIAANELNNLMQSSFEKQASPANEAPAKEPEAPLYEKEKVDIIG